METEKEHRPIRSTDDLLAPFFEACKPRADWRIGLEAEKFGVYVPSAQPIPFHGDTGIEGIFSALIERYGWQPEREVENGPLIALRRAHTSLTLEPGAQLELSGSPLQTVHEICKEFHEHMKELHAVADPMRITWLGLGFHPFATQEELPWVPKLRYGVMRSYLPTRGTMALDMMRRTCTVQANFDYASEEDAVRKLRVALAIQPLVTAMFANSPLVEGKDVRERSHRARVWLNVDPDRSGLLPFAWRPDMSFERYVNWALDVPMFLIKRNDQVIHNTGQTFRDFWKNGFQSHRASLIDWHTHLNTLFPEVRLKNTLEVRGADGQATVLTCALPALWKGWLYDEKSFNQLEEKVLAWEYKHVEEVRHRVFEQGLRLKLLNRSLADWAQLFFEISRDGLERFAALNAQGKDETIHLRRLGELIEHGHSPADALLSALNPKLPFKPQVLELTKI